MGDASVHDEDRLREYVGKILRWTRFDAHSSRLINEYIILAENKEGERMLVYNVRHCKLNWMTHAERLLGINAHNARLELVDP